MGRKPIQTGTDDDGHIKATTDATDAFQDLIFLQKPVTLYAACF